MKYLKYLDLIMHPTIDIIKIKMNKKIMNAIKKLNWKIKTKYRIIKTIKINLCIKKIL